MLCRTVPRGRAVWEKGGMRILNIVLLVVMSWLSVPMAASAHVFRDVIYDHIPGVGDGNLTMDIYAPDEAKKAPVVIMVHGGAWTYGNKQNAIGPYQADFFTDEGFVYISINYRLAPDLDSIFHRANPHGIHRVLGGRPFRL